MAENIYYDYNNLADANVVYLPADVLKSRRTICAGYAALLKDLILAQGIPSMETTTFAMWLGTDGGSFATYMDNAWENHAHVEAYVDGRWVIMDPTWDSHNRYVNGVYETKKPTFYYFDITPELMALDHKYITRGNGNIRLVDGTVVGADPVPVETAVPTSSTVLVNGAEKRFDAYNINNSNYFKLRDLAYVLSGSGKQFEVFWDAAAEAIHLVSQSAYTPVGGELALGDGSNRNATLNTSVIYLDGCLVSLKAYTINGSNYFKLRDLGSALDFDVSWDEATETITIDTASSYTPD